MRIAAAASAFPQHRYDQQAVCDALARIWQERLPRPEVLRRLHRSTGVEQRFFALPLECYPTIDTWGKANSLWIKAAEELAATAIRRALDSLGLAPTDVGALFFVTVTGVASPSIDARLVNRLGMSPQLKRMPIFGLGCVGGAAGVARAADYVRAFPRQVAVVLSVEICSLTWQRDDLSAANLISSGLFGDGAAAVVVAGAESGLAGPEIVDTQSTFYPDTEELMGWDVSENGFRIVLSPEVPAAVERNLGGDADRFLARHGIGRADIASWIIHTGGPKVLDAVAKALGIGRRELEASWNSLREVGNLSSASLLVVLQEFLERRRGAAGSYSVMAAMGPGFCSELLLLRW